MGSFHVEGCWTKAGIEEEGLGNVVWLEPGVNTKILKTTLALQTDVNANASGDALFDGRRAT